ncbi:probable G-protein coupled receptor 141 [Erpetoichthys calabaricus]|uniref:probable G-protein coupled receptor 141 n=1 Tax=Erpetoichthys calabaricus TaxID=27687 RepID=UPI002234C377|nr:probable G-protein coupled receptor 141 [Erpetoichthys calabaricus]
MTSSNCGNNSHTENQEKSIVLAATYSIVLLGGSVGVVLMIFILKSNIKSVTTTAVLNLIAVHILLLLTVPFRIHYYVTGTWIFTRPFCKLVSAMIHAHMYIAFIFYVIILVTRYVVYFNKMNKMEFYRKLHALGASAGIWAVITVIVFPIYLSQYGNTCNTEANNTQCFHFENALSQKAVSVLNYIIIIIIILVVCLLLICQLYIIWKVVSKYRQFSYQHQEFWAQIKSFSFVIIMVVCFIPCHIFRIYFMASSEENYSVKYFQNEMVLALTAFSCFDLIIFLGRGSHLHCSTLCKR